MLVLSPAARTACPPLPAPRLAPRRPAAPGTRPLALLVDGPAGRLAALRTALESGGCDVLPAACGHDVLAWLAFARPDLLLLEPLLPGALDADALCRRVRVEDHSRHLPIVFLGADPAASLRLFEAGATDVLPRCQPTAELLARLRVHASQGAQWRRLEEQNAALRAEAARHREQDGYLQRSLDRAAVLVDDGRVTFCTVPARRLLARFFPAHHARGVLPPALADWLAGGARGAWRLERDGSRLEATVQGPAHLGSAARCLLLLAETTPASPGAGSASLARLGLTPREAEVLYWIAHGKTNPETGIILRAAPNTIKKHMQNIMLKLGVETRLAAASRALEVIGLS